MTQDKKKEISFFDRFVKNKNQYAVFSKKGYEKLFFELEKSLVSNKKNIKIVDLGCGTGSFTKKISSLSDQIYGCDISTESIKTASNFYPKINFSVQDIENLSYQNNFFDIVIFSGVLHHFDNLNKPLLEAKRILKDDGLIFAFDPNLYNPFFWMYRRKKSFLYSNEGVTDNEEPLTKKKIITAIKSCEFNSFSVYGISGVPFNYIENNKLSLFLPIYNFVDALLNMVPFIRNKIGSFLITKINK